MQDTTKQSSNKSIDWYFDFISPFAYFQHYTLINHYPDVTINYYPILFGAVLQNHGNKGPAEIPSKRIMTYRYCTWQAKKRGIPFKFPDVHPYKPVSVLRLALAAGINRENVTCIFHYIWVQGNDPSSPENLLKLASKLGLKNMEKAIQQPSIKKQLRDNTERASLLELFGVPTIMIDDKLFWGDDLTEMAMGYLSNPELFDSEDYQRLETLPNGLTP